MKPLIIIPNAIMHEMAVDVWRAVLADEDTKTDGVHDGCEKDAPGDCSMYDTIATALEATLDAHGYRIALPEDK